ncbi:hypothetical protein ACFQ0B_47450 [Nonomuraea thailandensis]
MELATICPVATMGPVLGRAVSGANHIVRRSLNGDLPGYPDLYVRVVDVRDVAAARVVAMTAPGAAGRRFLVASGEAAIAMKEIGVILRERSATRPGGSRRAPSPTWPSVSPRPSGRGSGPSPRISATSGACRTRRRAGCSTCGHDRLLRRSWRRPSMIAQSPVKA